MYTLPLSQRLSCNSDITVPRSRHRLHTTSTALSLQQLHITTTTSTLTSQTAHNINCTVIATTSHHNDHFDAAFCPGLRDLAPSTVRPDGDVVCPVSGCLDSPEFVDEDLGSLAAAAAAAAAVVAAVVAVLVAVATVLPVRLRTAAQLGFMLNCFVSTSCPPLRPLSAL